MRTLGFVVVGPRVGKTPLYASDGKTLNPKLSNENTKKLGKERETLILEKEIKEIDKENQDDLEIANNENEEPVVRERAHERIQGRAEQRNALVREKEQLEEGYRIQLQGETFSQSKRFPNGIAPMFLIGAENVYFMAGPCFEINLC